MHGQEPYERSESDTPITDGIKRNNLNISSVDLLSDRSHRCNFTCHPSMIVPSSPGCALHSRTLRQVMKIIFSRYVVHRCHRWQHETWKRYDLVLVGWLDDLIPPRENAGSHTVEVINLDGATIVNMLAPCRHYEHLI